MTYRISYIDTSAALPSEQWPGGMTRTEDFPTEPAALARARELLEDGHYHRVVVTDGARELMGGICLQLRLGLTGE
jgi:hypothetical protein